MKRQKATKPPRVTPAFLAVDQITRAAEAHGWQSRDAFFLAMMMHAHGITPSEARKLFNDALERSQ